MPLRYCLAVCLKRKHSVRLGVTHLLLSHSCSSIFQLQVLWKCQASDLVLYYEKANGSLALSFSTSNLQNKNKIYWPKLKLFLRLQHTKNIKNQSQQQKLSTVKSSFPIPKHTRRSTYASFWPSWVLLALPRSCCLGRGDFALKKIFLFFLEIKEHFHYT